LRAAIFVSTRSTRLFVAGHLFTADLPDPDLLIRNQRRAAHQQFFALAVRLRRTGLYQDAVAGFRRSDLERAIADYSCRERRYGASVGSR